MIISGSSILMASNQVRTERHEQKESLTIWRQNDQIRQLDLSRDAPTTARLAAEMSGEVAQPAFSQTAVSLQPAPALLDVDKEDLMDAISELEISLFKLLVEALTGEKFNVVKPSDLTMGSQLATESITTEQSVANSNPPGFGLIYDYYESHFESEQTTFSAAGIIRTSDGQEIAINLQLSMSREFSSSESLQLRAGEALKDPLVVNFNGSAAQLTQRNFSFDIDADGRTDQIAFVKPGSGFLALDRNDDGIINNGNELFGARTGNGFAELADHDQDGNGWIDAADSIYDRLRIWSLDSEGNEQLFALGRRGVGAIYLGHVSTPFLLKGADNETLGQTRASGLYLNDQSGVGSIQQLDLAV